MARSFRRTTLGTTTATVTAKMVVTVMMVMFHCVVVHSASRYPTDGSRSPQNHDLDLFNFPDITSGVYSGSTHVEEREKDHVSSADQPLTPAGFASTQAEEGSSPDRQTGQDVSLTDTTNINSLLASGVQELTSEMWDATHLGEGEQSGNAPNTTTEKYDMGADEVKGFALPVGRDELPIEDERKTDSVDMVPGSSLDEEENGFQNWVSDGDEAFLSTPDDGYTQTKEDVESFFNTMNDVDSDLATLPKTSMAPSETPENDTKFDSQDSLSSSVEPFATSNDVTSWSSTAKRSTMKSELRLSSEKEVLYTLLNSLSLSANTMQGFQRTKREFLSTGSAQSKTEDPNITVETEWTKEAAILFTALDTSADHTKNPPAPGEIDGTKESPFHTSKGLTIGPRWVSTETRYTKSDGVSRDPGRDDSEPLGAVRGSPDTTEAPEITTAILFLGRSSEESSAGSSEETPTVLETDGSTQQEKTALGDVTAAVTSSETAADSSSRDASSRQQVGDVHSTGAQYGTEETQSDEHSQTSDTLTSQSIVPKFVTSRSDSKGQGRVSKRRSPNPRVTTPVQTMIVRRETKQGESALVNTQTTTSAAETDLISTSEHLAEDTSTVPTTTEMSTTTTTTMTTTRRPLVLGDTCSSSSDCQQNINRSSCTSGVCVCAKGYFQRETRCYAEPRNLTVTLRNDSVDISWDGDNIEYAVYINISSKYNTTFKMFDVTGTQIDFSPSHPGTVIRAMVTVSGSNRFNVTATLPIAPSSPERLIITFVNDTCLEAEWAPGTGVTDQYRVDVIQLGKTTRHETTQTTWSYCRLSPGELFNVTVYAMSNSVLSRVPASVFDYTNPSKPKDGRLQDTPLTNSVRVDILWLPGSNKDKEFVVTVENRTDIHPSMPTSWGSWYRSIIHISYGSRYTVNIQAVNHEKKSSPLQLTGCTVPGTVEKLTVLSSGYNWIDLEWTPPAGDVDSFEYEVTVQKSRSRDRVHVTNTISYRVDSLSPGTSYTLKVRVMFCNLTSGYTVVDGATSLDGLSEFEVHSLLDSPVLNITWEHSLRDKGGVAFQLTVSENNETVIYNQNITQSPLSVPVNSFGKCFLVTLLVTGTSRSISGTKWKSTPEKAPGPVVHLSYSRLTQDRTSLNISWSRPEVTNGIITEYRLSVNGTRGGNYLKTLTCQGNHCRLHCGNKVRTRKATFQGGSTSSFSGDEKHFSVLVTNLSLYENYDILVVAFTSQYQGPDSQIKTDDQLLDAVENFSGRAHNASCLSLDWGYPVNGNSSDVLDFVLRYRKNSDTSLETTEPSNTSYTKDISLLLCGLDYFTNYTLSIAAVNKVGEGRVQEKYFHTAEFVPDAVTGLTVQSEVDTKKPRTLSITWKEPLNKYGIIRAYYVIISNSRGIVREVKVLPEDQPYHLQQYLWTENFTIQVFAETNAGNGSRASSLTQIPEGVLPPTQEEIKVDKSMKEHPATSAVAELPASLLCNHSYGSPVRTGLIVSNSLEQLSGERQTGPEPKVYKSWSEDKSLYYVRVELGHHCQESLGQSFKVLLGGDGNCAKGEQHCNGFLTADTEYRFQAVMCTSVGCTYSPVSSPYRTDKMPEDGSNAAAVAAGVVVVLLLAVVGAAVGFIFFRKYRREKERERNDDEAQRCRMEDISRNRPVKLDDFAEHVDRLHRDSNLAFSEEYKMIKELSREYPTNAAELPACKLKNRYTNILPWDHTRVKLIPTDDEEGSDYINANYLPGYTHRREFIAAQGPLPATIDDFWRMVWENRVCIIVMLTQCVEKGKVKCEKYWPEENEAVFHGDLVVQVRSQSVLPDYIIRVIDVKMGNQTRMIKHFHFMRWPDHGCPEKTSMLLNFVSAVRAHTPHSGSGPILVHCSAGVGRTGTFVALDQLLQQIRQEDEVDIFGLVLGMRDCRTQMVQTENQYIYIHDCLVDALVKDSDDEESGADNDDHIYGNC